MSLLEEHKTERRQKIQRAARRLVAERGYDGLTMRDLAEAARVSVPTLYNLFGSKDAILIAELQNIAGELARTLPMTGDSFMQRGMVAFEAGMRSVEESPEFFRAVTRMFMTSPDSSDMRRRSEDAFIAIMAANLVAAKQAGQLADWAEPAVVARHMFGQYMATFLSWSIGELDLPTFRVAAESGICHILIGAARGPFAAEIEARLRFIQVWAHHQEKTHAASRR
ncbi:MAG TPA: TetR/AcrR family transcriptional regulator [Kofleriaceae bacterium]|nr:TetR/AcrR family transcriptional regulator [Kofleriaceae bacterium]